MNRSTPAVHVDGIVKRFGDVTAVDHLSLDIHPGEVVAFLGPNGAGKTTTVDMILGLTRPDEGVVEVFGGDARAAVALGRVAAVMQSGGLLKDFTLRETVELTASLFRPARPVDEVLERAGILDVADRPVGKASGGQQQRLRFALALLPDPDLLILDEPTTGMDVQGRRDFWSAIRSDAARGRTTVFATHYLEEADAYADRIVLVRHGRVVADGTAAEIKAMASGRTVRATLPNADAASLARLAGVDAVDVRGDSVIVHGSDSDAIARHLLGHTEARDLEITSRNLEEAFVALTADEAPTTETPATGDAIPEGVHA
ncbi:ABC transporter ATP-binding protein [Aeromicrobium endophyticum]|uniref:ABC transporter ATP-binding protein n=1 Tax=Aeromicrobium endophyticum TaxID=2292704 RepID=A0A371P1B2_9ACTN|nr:ABC transporter ATP-binding protein [Aeromicrobium endophyticum]REK69727.1 ABC transporter ATP-binding protein [Aeromicrobium endophyticum]